MLSSQTAETSARVLPEARAVVRAERHGGEGATSVTLNRTRAASGLKLESVTQTNGQTTVSFAAAADQTDTVEWSDQLSVGCWRKLSDVVTRSFDTIATVTDSNAATPSRFYRVGSPRRP